MCGFVTGLYIQWQTRETARHDLRSIAICMGVHVKQCKGNGEHMTEPWTVYMDKAISAYHRYRALILPWNREALDKAWRGLQGVDPVSESFLDYVGMMESVSNRIRVYNFIKFLG